MYQIIVLNLTQDYNPIRSLPFNTGLIQMLNAVGFTHELPSLLAHKLPILIIKHNVIDLITHVVGM
jgi:hypothetical protein